MIGGAEGAVKLEFHHPVAVVKMDDHILAGEDAAFSFEAINFGLVLLFLAFEAILRAGECLLVLLEELLEVEINGRSDWAF